MDKDNKSFVIKTYILDNIPMESQTDVDNIDGKMEKSIVVNLKMVWDMVVGLYNKVEIYIEV